ncbi:MAG: hypothetical protein GC150_12320, partial [Rhizobiales bacterium]|nr:hypothetical protein [Hyphomicrobiales bacterium]
MEAPLCRRLRCGTVDQVHRSVDRFWKTGGGGGGGGGGRNGGGPGAQRPGGSAPEQLAPIPGRLR